MDKKLWLRNTENFVLFDACDMEFYPMTLILKLDLDDMPKMSSIGQGVIIWTERQIDRYV